MLKKRRKITHFFGGIGIALDQLTLVACRRGAYGRITLFQHPELGKVFVLNGEIQHVEAWAPLYHEPLVHLPVSFVKEVKEVMIFGGGTLYAASEVLKYKSVERVIVFDHDPQVPEITAEYYSHARACFNDNRFTIVHEDAYSSVARFKNRFDLIINDGTDLISTKSPGHRARSRSNLFLTMTKALKPTGVCADVIYRHLFERQRILHTISHLQRSTRFALSLVFLPEYHGALHILSIWGGRASSVTQTLVRPKNKEQLCWVKNQSTSPCVYYDPRFLHYYLYLPPYLKTALAAKKRVA
jgi:spermidine synthase